MRGRRKTWTKKKMSKRCRVVHPPVGAQGQHLLLELPLGAKVPIIPGVRTTFYTTNLSERLYQDSASFVLTDPNSHQIDSTYNSLHDPNLKQFFNNRNRQRLLVKRGLITPHKKVICTPKEFNQYREYLTTVKLDWEKSYLEQQKELVKQFLILQERNEIPQDVSVCDMREWLLEHGSTMHRDGERAARMRLQYGKPRDERPLSHTQLTWRVKERLMLQELEVEARRELRLERRWSYPRAAGVTTKITEGDLNIPPTPGPSPVLSPCTSMFSGPQDWETKIFSSPSEADMSSLLESQSSYSKVKSDLEMKRVAEHFKQTIAAEELSPVAKNLVEWVVREVSSILIPAIREFEELRRGGSHTRSNTSCSEATDLGGAESSSSVLQSWLYPSPLTSGRTSDASPSVSISSPETGQDSPREIKPQSGASATPTEEDMRLMTPETNFLALPSPSLIKKAESIVWDIFNKAVDIVSCLQPEAKTEEMTPLSHDKAFIQKAKSIVWHVVCRAAEEVKSQAAGADVQVAPCRGPGSLISSSRSSLYSHNIVDTVLERVKSSLEKTSALPDKKVDGEASGSQDCQPSNLTSHCISVGGQPFVSSFGESSSTCRLLGGHPLEMRSQVPKVENDELDADLEVFAHEIISLILKKINTETEEEKDVKTEVKSPPSEIQLQTAPKLGGKKKQKSDFKPSSESAICDSTDINLLSIQVVSAIFQEIKCQMDEEDLLKFLSGEKQSKESLQAREIVTSVLAQLKNRDSWDKASKTSVIMMKSGKAPSKTVVQQASTVQSHIDLSSNEGVAEMFDIFKSKFRRAVVQPVCDIIEKAAAKFIRLKSTLSPLDVGRSRESKETGLQSHCDEDKLSGSSSSEVILVAWDIVNAILKKLVDASGSADTTCSKESEFKLRTFVQAMSLDSGSVDTVASGMSFSLSQIQLVSGQLVNTVVSKLKAFVSQDTLSSSSSWKLSSSKSPCSVDCLELISALTPGSAPARLSTPETYTDRSPSTSAGTSNGLIGNSGPLGMRQDAQERQSNSHVDVKNVVSQILRSVKTERAYKAKHGKEATLTIDQVSTIITEVMFTNLIESVKDPATVAYTSPQIRYTLSPCDSLPELDRFRDPVSSSVTSLLDEKFGAQAKNLKTAKHTFKRVTAPTFEKLVLEPHGNKTDVVVQKVAVEELSSESHGSAKVMKDVKPVVTRPTGSGHEEARDSASLQSSRNSSTLTEDIQPYFFAAKISTTSIQLLKSVVDKFVKKLLTECFLFNELLSSELRQKQKSCPSDERERRRQVFRHKLSSGRSLPAEEDRPQRPGECGWPDSEEYHEILAAFSNLLVKTVMGTLMPGITYETGTTCIEDQGGSKQASSHSCNKRNKHANSSPSNNMQEERGRAIRKSSKADGKPTEVQGTSRDPVKNSDKKVVRPKIFTEGSSGERKTSDKYRCTTIVVHPKTPSKPPKYEKPKCSAKESSKSIKGQEKGAAKVLEPEIDTKADPSSASASEQNPKSESKASQNSSSSSSSSYRSVESSEVIILNSEVVQDILSCLMMKIYCDNVGKSDPSDDKDLPSTSSVSQIALDLSDSVLKELAEFEGIAVDKQAGQKNIFHETSTVNKVAIFVYKVLLYHIGFDALQETVASKSEAVVQMIASSIARKVFKLQKPTGNDSAPSQSACKSSESSVVSTTAQDQIIKLPAPSTCVSIIASDIVEDIITKLLLKISSNCWTHDEEKQNRYSSALNDMAAGLVKSVLEDLSPDQTRSAGVKEQGTEKRVLHSQPSSVRKAVNSAHQDLVQQSGSSASLQKAVKSGSEEVTTAIRAAVVKQIYEIFLSGCDSSSSSISSSTSSIQSHSSEETRKVLKSAVSDVGSTSSESSPSVSSVLSCEEFEINCETVKEIITRLLLEMHPNLFKEGEQPCPAGSSLPVSSLFDDVVKTLSTVPGVKITQHKEGSSCYKPLNITRIVQSVLQQLVQKSGSKLILQFGVASKNKSVYKDIVQFVVNEIIKRKTDMCAIVPPAFVPEKDSQSTDRDLTSSPSEQENVNGTVPSPTTEDIVLPFGLIEHIIARLLLKMHPLVAPPHDFYWHPDCLTKSQLCEIALDLTEKTQTELSQMQGVSIGSEEGEENGFPRLSVIKEVVNFIHREMLETIGSKPDLQKAVATRSQSVLNKIPTSVIRELLKLYSSVSVHYSPLPHESHKIISTAPRHSGTACKQGAEDYAMTFLKRQQAILLGSIKPGSFLLPQDRLELCKVDPFASIRPRINMSLAASYQMFFVPEHFIRDILNILLWKLCPIMPVNDKELISKRNELEDTLLRSVMKDIALSEGRDNVFSHFNTRMNQKAEERMVHKIADSVYHELTQGSQKQGIFSVDTIYESKAKHQKVSRIVTKKLLLCGKSVHPINETRPAFSIQQIGEISKKVDQLVPVDTDNKISLSEAFEKIMASLPQEPDTAAPISPPEAPDSEGQEDTQAAGLDETPHDVQIQTETQLAIADEVNEDADSGEQSDEPPIEVALQTQRKKSKSRVRRFFSRIRKAVCGMCCVKNRSD
nr:PREDICTED: uncharacterized protein LOC107077925 [Lepisosteus oculatus]